MLASGWWRTGARALFVLGITSPVAHADLFRDVAFGLGYAGFDIEGSRNQLSGGVDFGISRNLVGNPLDFGAWDLTLRGPVSLTLSTGGRRLSQLDAALTIDLSGSPAVGLPGYELDYDVGGQSTHIDGTLVVDAAFSLNGFGFYDLGLTYSSRQDVARHGRFADDTQTFDADLGPINISGNIFADALALITQPLFERAGRTNPFTSFSGRGSLADLLTGSADDMRDRLAAGDDPVEDDRSRLLATTTLSRLFSEQSARLLPPSSQPGVVFTPAGAAVPEPTVLLLMLLGLPAVIRRRPRRRNNPQ